jgi:hypothetical protein
MASFGYEDFAFADHLELIGVDHDDGVGIDANAEKLGMGGHYRFQIVFAVAFGNVLIYRAVG